MSHNPEILLVDDEDLILFVLSQLLKVHGYQVRTASRGEEALSMIETRTPALVILDIRMPGLSGFEVLHRLRSSNPQLPVILMTALAGVRDAVEAMKAGAFDYVSKPFDNNEMIVTVERALAQQPAADASFAPALVMGKIDVHPVFHVLGKGHAIQRIASWAQKYTDEGRPCLLTGEIGTGKRKLARLMHEYAGDDQPFLTVDCAGANESQLRTELFGGGSATGPARRGKMEMVKSGTLVITEVGDMPPMLQQAVAETIANRSFVHPATGAAITVPGRVLFTMNTERGIEQLVTLVPGIHEQVRSRSIMMPPLRDRLDDIPTLVSLFIEEASTEFQKIISGIDDAAMELLTAYEWPGNVHQLKSIIRRAALGAGRRITSEHIEVSLPHHPERAYPPIAVTNHPLRHQVRQHVAQVEREMLIDTLRRTGWNKAKASRLLGITYKTMLKKVAEHGLDAGEEGDRHAS